jgi:two-component sensor histidine kinase
MAIEEDSKGNMWFGTYGGGVSMREKDNFTNYDFEDGLNNNTVWSLESVGDQLWVGTSDGINLIENGRISNFSLNDSLPFIRVSSVFNDSENNQWVGTRDGLVRISNFKISTPIALKKAALTEVKSFCQIKDTVWISSRSGVVGWSLKESKLVIPANRQFQDLYVSSVASAGNLLWAGTDDGIFGYDVNSHSLVHHTIGENPSTNIVNFLSSDSQGNLWIGTDNGLFSLHNDSLNRRRIRSYNEHDGIIGRECNQNAAFLANNGSMWFGLNGSLINLKPDFIPSQEIRGEQAKLRELLLNFEPIELANHFDAEYDGLAFDYQKNRLTIRFSAIHFTNPEKVEYSYRLLGSGEEWSPAIRDNSVTYASLAAGEYEFQARIKLENTKWGTPTSLIRFKILPPFYLTWWFIMLSLSALGLISYVIYRQIKHQQKRRQALLTIQNQAKILGLEQQTLNAHMNRHFIFNALNSIQYYINTKEKKMANSYLTQFAALVRKNLDSAQEQNIALKDEIDRLKLYMNLEQMRFPDRFSYRITIEETIDTSQLQVPSMILQPFVENSIMHGILPSNKHGEIDITIYTENDSIFFEIIDNGIGINKSVQQKSKTSHHVSNGMKITKQRLAVLSNIYSQNYGVAGPEERKNQNGESMGTIVRIKLPKLDKLSTGISTST